MNSEEIWNACTGEASINIIRTGIQGQVTVVELKSMLQVSLDTVRRDLERLEQEDKLQRVHGEPFPNEKI